MLKLVKSLSNLLHLGASDLGKCDVLMLLIFGTGYHLLDMLRLAHVTLPVMMAHFSLLFRLIEYPVAMALTNLLELQLFSHNIVHAFTRDTLSLGRLILVPTDHSLHQVVLFL